MAKPTKSDLLETANGLGLEVTEENTVAQIQEAIASAAQLEANTTESKVAPAAKASEGSEIARAIAEGMKGAKDDKTIRIVGDPNVNSRFSVVRNRQTGEFLVRDNEGGGISPLQLKSIEEKQASLQGLDVEER